jgi:hypothetical protein
MVRLAKLSGGAGADPEDDAFAKVHVLRTVNIRAAPGGSELTGRRWEQSRRFLFLGDGNLPAGNSAFLADGTAARGWVPDSLATLCSTRLAG